MPDAPPQLPLLSEGDRRLAAVIGGLAAVAFFALWLTSVRPVPPPPYRQHTVDFSKPLEPAPTGQPGKPEWLYRILEPVESALNRSALFDDNVSERRAAFGVVVFAWAISVYMASLGTLAALRWVQAGYKR